MREWAADFRITRLFSGRTLSISAARLRRIRRGRGSDRKYFYTVRYILYIYNFKLYKIPPPNFWLREKSTLSWEKSAETTVILFPFPRFEVIIITAKRILRKIVRKMSDVGTFVQKGENYGKLYLGKKDRGASPWKGAETGRACGNAERQPAGGVKVGEWCFP